MEVGWDRTLDHHRRKRNPRLFCRCTDVLNMAVPVTLGSTRQPASLIRDP